MQLVLGFPRFCDRQTFKVILALLLCVGVAATKIGTGVLPGLCISAMANGDHNLLPALLIATASAFIGMSVLNAASSWVGQILSLYWYASLATVKL